MHVRSTRPPRRRPAVYATAALLLALAGFALVHLAYVAGLLAVALWLALAVLVAVVWLTCAADEARVRAHLARLSDAELLAVADAAGVRRTARHSAEDCDAATTALPIIPTAKETV